MSNLRNDVLDWMRQGRLQPQALLQAADLAELEPGKLAWRQFLDAFCLWLGALFLALALIFFFAYNWQEMGRYAKFGLVELLIAGAGALVWRLGLDSLAGKAALLFAGLMAGALLALVGQTYQTGADTFELFAAWAVALLPLALVGRMGAMWVIWLALVNVAATLYYQVFGRLSWAFFDLEKLLWVLFGINVLALLVWEWFAARGLAWMRQRWTARIFAVASGSMLTSIVLYTIFDDHGSRMAAPLAYLAWMLATCLYYQQRCTDIFVLAGNVLSFVVVVDAFLGRVLIMHGGDGSFLVIGSITIGLSAGGGLWLKNLAEKERA
jgi:uncharacterized membrane protein